MAISLTNITPYLDSETNDNTPTISFRVTDDGGVPVTGKLFYKFPDTVGVIIVNGARAQPSGTMFSLQPHGILPDGPIEWWVSGSQDPEGSGATYNPVTSEYRTMKIDTVAPNKPNCSISALTPTSARVYSEKFSDPDPSSGYSGIVAYLTRWTGSTWVSDGQKTFPSFSSEYVDFTGLNSANQYRARVRHWDKAGNYTYSDYVTLTLNSAPAAPAISTPTANGSTFNKRPEVIVNVPVDTDGDAVKIQAVFKNGTNTICTVESGMVPQGTGTVILTPTADLPPGVITVELSAYDGAEWSTTNSYTFTVVAEPSFPVLATDTGIRAAYLNNLTAWINNARQFRGLTAFSFTDGDVTKNVTQIKKVHLDERRAKTAEALAVVGVTPAWTDPVITAGVTERKGTHWIEVFNYLKQI